MLYMVQGNTASQYSWSEGTHFQDITKETRWFVSCAAYLYSLQRIPTAGFKRLFIQFLKFNCGLKSIAFRTLNWDFKFRTDFTTVLKGFDSLVTGFTSSNYRCLKVNLNYSVSTPSESNRETGTSKRNCTWTGASIWKCLFLTTDYKRSLGWLSQQYTAKLKKSLRKINLSLNWFP